MSTFGRPTLVRINDVGTGETARGRPYISIGCCRVAAPSVELTQRIYVAGALDDEVHARLLNGMAKRSLYTPFGVPWPEQPAVFNPRPFVGRTAFAVPEVTPAQDPYPARTQWCFSRRAIDIYACRGCLKAAHLASDDGLCDVCFVKLIIWAGAREEQFTDVLGANRLACLIAKPVAVDQWMEERNGNES